MKQIPRPQKGVKAGVKTMRKNHNPLILQRFIEWFWNCYTRHFIAPQFETLGSGLELTGPRNLELYGGDIHLGKNAHIQTARGQITRLTTWPDGNGRHGKITIGNHVLISPAFHAISCQHIEIGDNVMIAGHVYISDADWHGIYDRTASPGASAPIRLEDNVWIGEGAKILKGVRIGKNSIIGAGAVVTQNIPANVVAGGAPAQIVKKLNGRKRFTKRETLFADRPIYEQNMRYLKTLAHQDNRWLIWLRSKLSPTKND